MKNNKKLMLELLCFDWSNSLVKKTCTIVEIYIVNEVSFVNHYFEVQNIGLFDLTEDV